MKFLINVETDITLHITVNSSKYICLSSRTIEYELDKDQILHIKVEQIPPKFRWYVFPVYLIGGLFNALMCYGSDSGYSSLNNAIPYVHHLTIDVTSSNSAGIFIKSKHSTISLESGKPETDLGYIAADEIDPGKCSSDIIKNTNMVKHQLLKSAFAFLSVQASLWILLLWMIIYTDIHIFVDILIVIFLMLLLAVSVVKINSEKKKLRSLIASLNELRFDE